MRCSRQSAPSSVPSGLSRRSRPHHQRRTHEVQMAVGASRCSGCGRRLRRNRSRDAALGPVDHDARQRRPSIRSRSRSTSRIPRTSGESSSRRTGRPISTSSTTRSRPTAERALLAPHPGTEPDLRRLRNDHELHVQRSPLHAAGLHRRAGVRGRRRRHGAQGARTRAASICIGVVAFAVQFLPVRGGRDRIDADLSRASATCSRRGGTPAQARGSISEQELSGQLAAGASNQGLPE